LLEQDPDRHVRDRLASHRFSQESFQLFDQRFLTFVVDFRRGREVLIPPDLGFAMVDPRCPPL
jgi:hypothetical protein